MHNILMSCKVNVRSKTFSLRAQDVACLARKKCGRLHVKRAFHSGLIAKAIPKFRLMVKLSCKTMFPSKVEEAIICLVWSHLDLRPGYFQIVS